MSKITKYVLIMSGVSILFYFAGLIEGNSLLNLLFNPEDMTQLAIWSTILTSVLSTATGVVIGITTRNIELAVMTAFLPVIVGFLWEFINVFKVLASFNAALALLVLAPILLLFFIDMLDYWRAP